MVPVKRAQAEECRVGRAFRVDGMRGVLLDTLTLGQCTFKTDLLGAQHHPSKLLIAQSMCGMLNAVLAPKETD